MQDRDAEPQQISRPQPRATRIGGGTSGISFAWTNAHTSSAPRPGGMAAVVSNGNSNPAGPINGQMSNS
jgi:hypothetical protein